MIDKVIITDKLRAALEPLPFIHAFWMEGADAIGTADRYSDLDYWVDFDDEQETQAIAATETALSELAAIDYQYVCHHPHPKIRQRIYHLAGTDEYLMIDFCWQLHSRPKDEYAYYENDFVEGAKVIFDKSGVIQYRKMDLSSFRSENKERLEEACYRRTQYCRAMKYIRRRQYLEAYAYYNRYILEPLIDLLRLLYTPAYADYYLIHISQHIPQKQRKHLEYFAQIGSLEDMEIRIAQAGEWFDGLLETLKEHYSSDLSES